MTAADPAGRLQGMFLLIVATVGRADDRSPGRSTASSTGAASTSAPDPTALRWRHLQRKPAVSATHLPSENWKVVVHGGAVPIDIGRSDPEGPRATLLSVYTPRYGPSWEAFLDSSPVYARIDADRMFALDVRRACRATSP